MPDRWTLELFEGHLIATNNGVRALLDTGSPLSIGRGGSVMINGQRFLRPESAAGLSIASLTELVGCPFDVFLGIDILGQFRVLIDMSKNEIVFGSDTELHAPTTVAIRPGSIIPIIDVTVGGRGYRAAFDTGAATSYVPSEAVQGAGPGRFVNDFYPGLGRFSIETWMLPIEVQSRIFRVSAGTLPENLRALTLAFGIEVILGSEALAGCRTVLDFPGHRIEFERGDDG